MSRHQIRKQKWERSLMQALSEIILFEMEDERLKSEMITFTRVEGNPDFSQVTFYFTCHHLDKKNKVVKLLYQSVPFFRSLLSRKVAMKNVPQLKFFYDYKNGVDGSGQDVASLIDRLSAQYREQKSADKEPWEETPPDQRGNP